MAKNKENQTQATEESNREAMPPEAPQVRSGQSPVASLETKVPETSAPAPEEPKEPEAPNEPEPELFTLEALADKLRIPGWQSVALHKLMGWEPGKRVSEKDYKDGLARLKTRRIGG